MDGLFMAEPLAGVVSPDALAEFSAPYVTRIVAALQDERFPVIYHNCGANVVKAAEPIFAQGAAGYHFGNAIQMKDICLQMFYFLVKKAYLQNHYYRTLILGIVP